MVASLLSISLFAYQPLTQESLSLVIVSVAIGVIGVTFYSSKLLSLFGLIIVGGYVSSRTDLLITALSFSLLLLLIDLTSVSQLYIRVLSRILPGTEENISDELQNVLGQIMKRFGLVFSGVALISGSISPVSSLLTGLIGGPFALSIYATLAMTSVIILLLAAQKS